MTITSAFWLFTSSSYLIFPTILRNQDLYTLSRRSIGYVRVMELRLKFKQELTYPLKNLARALLDFSDHRGVFDGNFSSIPPGSRWTLNIKPEAFKTPWLSDHFQTIFSKFSCLACFWLTPQRSETHAIHLHSGHSRDNCCHSATRKKDPLQPAKQIESQVQGRWNWKGNIEMLCSVLTTWNKLKQLAIQKGKKWRARKRPKILPELKPTGIRLRSRCCGPMWAPRSSFARKSRTLPSDTIHH